MRRYWVLALAVLTLLGVASIPALAQEKPKTKVTIGGLLDFVTEWSENKHDNDSTNSETQWHSRERGRIFIQGAVGKAKVVWGIELDLNNGNNAISGVSAGFDLDTDVAGIVETKHLYLEFPLTGPGSLLPFIQIVSTARGGGQPFRNHDYKYGMLASGDYGGFSVHSVLTPTATNQFTFVQIEEGRSRTTGTHDDNWAIIDSLTMTAMKGLTVRPTFSYAEYDNAVAGVGAFLSTPARGGFTGTGLQLWRGTIGGDARWRMGAWSLDPTFHYQFGEQDISATREADVEAWIVDAIGGWRSGPLKLEGRVTYTTGNDADDCVQATAPTNPATGGAACSTGSDVEYYTPINAGFVGGYGGWTETFVGGIDYSNAFLGGSRGTGIRQAVGYDKYGRFSVAGRATYSVTPAFSVLGILGGHWTAEDVDTNGEFTASTATATSGIIPADGNGDDDYLGTEIVVGFTWRFAPNLRFDWRYSHFWTGDAFDQCQVVGGCATNAAVRDAEDVDISSARVRYTF